MNALATSIARTTFVMAMSVVALVSLTYLGTEAWRRHRHNDVSAIGIAEAIGVRVRGTEQFLFTRGYDRKNPILLFLPGGPGESFVPLSLIFSDELARKFVVVHFESGGVGRSEKYRTGPSLDDMVVDTTELVDYLRERFDRQAIYLVGHSFGSALALSIAAAHPEKVLGVATVGQVVNWRAGNELALEHLRALARQEQNEVALAELSRIPGDLIRSDDHSMIDFEAVIVQRKWLEHYDMMNVLKEHTAKVRWVSYLTSPVHSTEESCRLIYSGPCRWIADSPEWWRQWKNAIPGIVQFDATRDIPRLEVPYLAIIGANDWVTPGELLREYVSRLDAPVKKIVEIQDAQHYTFLDRPHEFQEAVSELLLLRPNTYEGSEVK